VTPDIAAAALSEFVSVKRRMELVAEVDGIQVFDDFAHHPTAIATTLAGASARMDGNADVSTDSGRRSGRLIAVLEPRSNTMKLGVHKHELAQSVAAADQAFWFQPANIDWSLQDVASQCTIPAQCYTELSALRQAIVAQAQPGDRIVVMSNGSFGGLPRLLAQDLNARKEHSDDG